MVLNWSYWKQWIIVVQIWIAEICVGSFVEFSGYYWERSTADIDERVCYLCPHMVSSFAFFCCLVLMFLCCLVPELKCGVHDDSVTYLRLDGSVESEKRFDIVRAFNSDPTIDVLLLTTHGEQHLLCP